MAKTKVEKTPMELLTKAFLEDFNDNELQERYEQFERKVKTLKGQYNELVPKINQSIDNSKGLAVMIVESAKMGFLNEQAIERIKEEECLFDELKKRADFFKKGFMDEEDLMKKYKDNSKEKLFHWWKAFKAIDKKTEPWLTWKRPYENKII
jgi:predicted transcriptional regulator